MRCVNTNRTKRSVPISCAEEQPDKLLALPPSSPWRREIYPLLGDLAGLFSVLKAGALQHCLEV